MLVLDLNGVVWDPDPPDVDGAGSAMLAPAAHGVDETWLAARLRERTRGAALVENHWSDSWRAISTGRRTGSAMLQMVSHHQVSVEGGR